MPTFAYAGRTRAGTHGERRAGRRHDGRGGRRAPARADPRHADQPGQGEGSGRRGEAQGRQAGEEGLGEEPCGVHAAVLGDDRRRPAPPCSASRSSAPSRRTRTSPPSSCRRGPTSRAARRWPTRCASHREGVRRAVHERDRGRRGRRHPRHDSQAAGHPYIEKAVKLTSQVKSAMIYPVAG